MATRQSSIESPKKAGRKKASKRKEGKKSARTATSRAAAKNDALVDAKSAAENVLGANPVVGMEPSDILDSLRRLARLFSLNPGLVARKEAEFTRELGRIALGVSKVKPDPKDRRFKHQVWHTNPFYKRVMQAYLAWGESLYEILDSIKADRRDKERARFMLMQIVDAAAPINNPVTNPGFIDNAIKTKGKSILRGLRNFADDMINNHGMPKQVDERPFEVGKNLANSKGAVVFRNAVCEVIQYAPRTEKVKAVPVLVVPPQINKYYIVDLAPDKSFVKYSTENEAQIFCISWRNPTAAQRDWGLETYVTAAREAIDAVREITGSDSVNLVAACAGGFTAAVLCGYLQAIGEGEKVNTLTLLVTVLDTSAETLLGLFANDTAIRAAIARSRQKGVLDGAQMARAFAWLRPTDLVWGFFANNYMMGNDPPAFDVLYWNNDTTRLPAQFHADLLHIFKQNPLVKSDGMKLLGETIDLKQVDCDVFIIAGITDHITPWDACYLSTRMFGGDVRFILSSSGHIQSIINPPSNSKAKFYYHDDYSLSAEQWLEKADVQAGSWWDTWLDWVKEHSKEHIEAPKNLGSEAHPPGDPAPGRYVFQR